MKASTHKIFPNFREGFYLLMLATVIVSLFLPMQINSISIGALGLSWLISNPFKDFFIKLKSNKVGVLFILFYALHGFGLLYSSNLDYGGKEMEYKLSMLLIPLFISTGPTLGKSQIKFLLRVFYVSTTIILLVATFLAINNLSQSDGSHLLRYFTYRHFSTPVGFDPIYLALFIVFASFALFKDQLLNNSPSIPKGITWFILIYFLIVLVFLSSRMEILVYTASVFAISLYFIWKTRKWKIPVFISVLIPIMIYGLISVNAVNKQRFTEMVDMKADYTENKWGGRSLRIEKWKNAIECWMTSPIIGVGSGDTIDELVKTYEKNEFTIAAENRFNPHNQYLQTSVALGIIGLLTLLAILFSLFKYGFKQDDWLLMIFSIIVGLSILTESMLERQKGLVFILVFSMLLSYTYQRQQVKV